MRAAISSFSWLDAGLVGRAMERLAADLESGEWARRSADLLQREELDCAYRLVVHG